MGEIEIQHFSKKILSLLLIIVVLITTLSLSVAAINSDVIDTNYVSQGYVTIYYPTSTSAKMKVGIISNNKTVYYNYEPMKESSYALSDGDGVYTITLYQNTQGNMYKKVAKKSVNVYLNNQLAPYLISTSEITFTENDMVCKRAHAICRRLSNDIDKVIAIRNYIARNIAYDYTLAKKVQIGLIKTYVPNASKTLSTGRGICYDSAALFAAMCRSENIPCVIEKGYIGDARHAWNKVYIDGNWYKVDVALPVTQNTFKN